MPSVEQTIKALLRGKDAGLRGGTFAMRDILRTLQKSVQAELGQAALGSWDAYHLKQALTSIERHMADYESLAKKEISGLLGKSWESGADLVEGVLEAAEMRVGYFGLSTSALDTLKEFSVQKMSGVARSAWENVRAEVTLGILGQKTPQEVSKAIGRNLREKSVFTSIDRRAETITKTEMGRTFSIASQKRMDDAAEHVRGLRKQWLHRGHPKRPRFTHVMLDGVHVPVKEKFNLGGGVKMMHPRDPAAPIEEIIHCGCDHVPYHPDWG